MQISLVLYQQMHEIFFKQFQQITHSFDDRDTQ